MKAHPLVELAEELDAQVDQADHLDAFSPTMFGWSRTVRDALGLTAADVAGRLDISQPAVTKLEKSEDAGTISVERLQALAEALECELVYGFLPKKGSFSEMATKRQAAIEKAAKKTTKAAAKAPKAAKATKAAAKPAKAAKATKTTAKATKATKSKAKSKKA